MTMIYVPHLTTPAACLTQANWHTLGMTYGLCDLSHMIIKPGLAFWKNGTNLATYLAWDRTLILDASHLAPNAQGQFVIRSPYDGSRHELTLDEFWDLVQQLKPDMLLLPQGIAKRPSDSIRLLTPGPELQEHVYTSTPEGLFLLDGAQTLYASDQPARDAVQGVVYQSNGASLSILDDAYAMDFRCLEEDCACPACQQSLTRAYLHHLLQSTPWLCQRFLLMHNIFNLPV